VVSIDDPTCMALLHGLLKETILGPQERQQASPRDSQQANFAPWPTKNSLHPAHSKLSKPHPLLQSKSRPVPHSNINPCETLHPGEIYATGGGLLVALMHTCHLPHLFILLCTDVKLYCGPLKQTLLYYTESRVGQTFSPQAQIFFQYGTTFCPLSFLSPSLSTPPFPLHFFLFVSIPSSLLNAPQIQVGGLMDLVFTITPCS